MRRTSPNKEQEVLTSILMGDTYATISQNTGVPVSTIKKIKKRSDIQMSELHTHVVAEQLNSTEALLKQVNGQVGRLLEEAELGIRDISVVDLCRIMEALHAQTVIKSSPINPTRTLTKIAQKYQ